MTFFSTIGDRRRRGTYDDNLVLRDIADGAESATASETGIAFDCRKIDQFKVCLAVDAYTGYDAGTAEWTLTVEVSDVVGGTYTQVGPSFIPVGAAIESEIVISGPMVEQVDADADWIRITATKTGSPGNITYGAWIVPC
ncbi:MAG: hypothetical protein AAFU78_21105 [Cyanobacteria bacterium J06633_2]